MGTLQLSAVLKDLVFISEHCGSTIAIPLNEDMAMWVRLVSALGMGYSYMVEFDGVTGPLSARRKMIGHFVVGVTLCHPKVTMIAVKVSV